jgi:hypothetical protein
VSRFDVSGLVGSPSGEGAEPNRQRRYESGEQECEMSGTKWPGYLCGAGSVLFRRGLTLRGWPAIGFDGAYVVRKVRATASGN